jgi:hypothetical protein
MTCDKIRDLTAVELEAVGGGLTFAIGLIWNISKTVTAGADLAWGVAQLAGELRPPPPPPPNNLVAM